MHAVHYITIGCKIHPTIPVGIGVGAKPVVLGAVARRVDPQDSSGHRGVHRLQRAVAERRRPIARAAPSPLCGVVDDLDALGYHPGSRGLQVAAGHGVGYVERCAGRYVYHSLGNTCTVLVVGLAVRDVGGERAHGRVATDSRRRGQLCAYEAAVSDEAHVYDANLDTSAGVATRVPCRRAVHRRALTGDRGWLRRDDSLHPQHGRPCLQDGQKLYWDIGLYVAGANVGYRRTALDQEGNQVRGGNGSPDGHSHGDALVGRGLLRGHRLELPAGLLHQAVKLGVQSRVRGPGR